MNQIVLLDSSPLGLITHRIGVRQADECRQWYMSLFRAGWQVLVPEIADYEVRRELLRAGKMAGVRRLDDFNAAFPNRYLPLTTAAFRLAAEFWASARRHGQPTAADPALDGDVLIAAQARLRGGDVIVATDNVRHLAQFAPARPWRQIQPNG